MNRILREVSHRPWPIPHGPWVMAQQWHDLLFAHWRVPQVVLQPLLPGGLELDLYHGEAWLAVVPFRMAGVRFRGLPAIPGTSNFPELNVRTYVLHRGKPGIWFFSLDASKPLAVMAARAWFHLPYFHARMSCKENDGSIEYASTRIHRGALPAEFRARYASIGPVFHSRPGTLEHFLTERYCLFARNNRGQILCDEIHHPPWPLQLAQAQFAENSMATQIGITLGDPDLLHFAKRQDVVVWPPKPE